MRYKINFSFFLLPFFLLITGCNSVAGSKSSLQITSDPQAKIIINGTDFGQTPFFSDQLDSNQTYQIKIQSNSGAYSEEIRLLPNTLTVINRQLSSIEQKTQGETVSLISGKNGLKVITLPSGAHVFVDGDFKGNSPLNVDNLSLGDHRISVKKDGFIERSVRVHVQQNYTVVANFQLSVVDDVKKVELPKIIIKDSPTGFLRVRLNPDINSPEISQVSPGQQFEVLDLNNNFVQIKIDELTTGWVSSEYVQGL